MRPARFTHSLRPAIPNTARAQSERPSLRLRYHFHMGISTTWRRFGVRIPAAILFAAWIFYQSSQSGLEIGGGLFEFVTTSLAHVVIYALLTALLWWALREVTPHAVAIAVVVAVLYGVSDEIHQLSVEGRSGSVSDLVFDALGALMAAALIRRYGRAKQPPSSASGEASPARDAPAPPSPGAPPGGAGRRR